MRPSLRIHHAVHLLVYGLVMIALAAWGRPAVAIAATNYVPIAHAGDDQTVEGGSVVTLDGTHSWDADGNPLIYTWTQPEGPLVTLNLTDPSRPWFTAPTPGQGGVAAENQVLVFRLTAGDGSATSTSDTRIMVLKPFDPVADAPGEYYLFPAGSYHAAISDAISHPGTRLTFAIR